MQERITQADPGTISNAIRMTLNLSSDVGGRVRDIAHVNRVSESSVVEIALRHLFSHIPAEAIGTYLRQHGACLRRRDL